MSRLPVDDRRVLHIARRSITMRGWADGSTVRDAYMHAHRQGGFHAQNVPPPASWTAALKRLERAGELVRVPLVGARGGRAGFGFDLATMAGFRSRAYRR